MEILCTGSKPWGRLDLSVLILNDVQDSLLNKCKLQHTEQYAQYDPIFVNTHTNKRNIDRYTQLTSAAPAGWNWWESKGTSVCLYCTHFFKRERILVLFENEF